MQFDRGIVENFLKNGLSAEVPAFTEDFFLRLGSGGIESVMFRQYMVMDMYFCATGFLRKLGCSDEEISASLGNLDHIQEIVSSRDEVRTYLEQLIEKTIQIRDTKATTRYGKLIDEAREYIQKNYADEDISLNSTAESVNLSPNHFSSIFSQETGQTFIEYLTGLRMDKARELLRCSDLKTSEIAYQVGYQDAHYFSYLFRKMNDCSPREYREKR